MNAGNGVPRPRSGIGETLHLGVDVGGTFTDVVVVDVAAAAGPLDAVRGKVPSTPRDPAEGVVAACRLAAETMGLELRGLLGRLRRFGLGTTVVTNVLATHTGRRLGLITTRGFEDLVPLARGNRVSVDGWLEPPPALVERTAIIGLDERTDRSGRVLRPVDVDDARAAAERLLSGSGVQALVVSLLWSFRNPANEIAVRDILAKEFPDVRVVIGSEVAPVIREYERTQFALLNAYCGGALDWLGPLTENLAANGLRAPLMLTHSSGGATTVDGARAVPIGLAMSGPAAGAAAATALVRARGDLDVVACDLGGTSLDVALISDGEVLRRTRGNVVGHWTSLSMVDVDSVGSGGGSVAYADALGAIRVGPRSAGADPGPACYDRGGSEPTLTDALVTLGYIRPDRFLDGRMPLRADLAETACRTLGEAVGLDPWETAWGIREVALATMARAVRARIASRGLVASDLTLLAYGGGGGLFAAGIAGEVGIRRVVVPLLASVFSAYGAATAPLHRERSQSLALRLPAGPEELTPTVAALRDAVGADLDADGVAPGDRTIRLEADIRFERQGAELTIPIPGATTVPPDAAPLVIDTDDLIERFRAEYGRRFGEGALATGVIVELMTLRAIGTTIRDEAPAVEPRTTAAASSPTTESPAPIGIRAIRLDRTGPPAPVPELRTADLAPGMAVAGPTVIDAGDTTVWIPPDATASVDRTGSLVIELGAS